MQHVRMIDYLHQQKRETTSASSSLEPITPDILEPLT